MNSSGRQTRGDIRLDDAARAGWLYYVAGNTQDEIARKLGVSRQTAQRFVSLAVSEGLVKVRIDHPISRCMELGAAVMARFDLKFCEIVPSDPLAPNLLTGVAIAGAAEMERHLKSEDPRIIAVGTGRTLRACIEELPTMSCPQHKIVSRLGNIHRDGSATRYNAVVRMAEKAGAPHYPMPLPVLAGSRAEVEKLHALEPVRQTIDLCNRADVTFVGIGQIDDVAPLIVDGFMTEKEAESLRQAGVAGEITGFVYNHDGVILTGDYNARVVAAPLGVAGDDQVIGIATGVEKANAIEAALRGGLINGLISNEATAQALLED